LRNPPKHRNPRFAQYVLDDRLAQARSIVIELQAIVLFVEPEPMQTVGICELAERAELFSLERVL